ncbi:glycosyltransferase family 2 protein [Bacillus cereus]|uniref:glycosyltransferase family 2 protein n=1 Tax=Bacillus cereus TaxID=1396 RepID=UPI000BEB8CFF|nr:glycosyltransferase family A protein [Bacillus cereus]PDY79664.1 hypothetical protein CON06_24145 [Bacillus cereus]PGL61293.1 hypothetical protein CN927_12010 [Bacillus cereus]
MKIQVSKIINIAQLENVRGNNVEPVEITVICSVKNGEKTIGTTIESIIKQSFKEWEFIIVDDGSTDNTSQIIESYVQKDSRIKLFVSGGIGRGRALNLAIKKSNGKYIANIDADDPSHPQRLEIQYQVMKNCKDFSVLSTNYLLISNYEDPSWTNISLSNTEVKDITHNIYTRNPVIHSSVLMKKEALIEVGLYSEDRTSLFDYELWLRLVGDSHMIGYIDNVLASKRFHQNQSYENKKRMKYLKDILALQKGALKDSKGKSSAYINIYLKFLYGLLPQDIRRIIIGILK